MGNCIKCELHTKYVSHYKIICPQLYCYCRFDWSRHFYRMLWLKTLLNSCSAFWSENGSWKHQSDFKTRISETKRQTWRQTINLIVTLNINTWLHSMKCAQRIYKDDNWGLGKVQPICFTPQATKFTSETVLTSTRASRWRLLSSLRKCKFSPRIKHEGIFTSALRTCSCLFSETFSKFQREKNKEIKRFGVPRTPSQLGSLRIGQ